MSIHDLGVGGLLVTGLGLDTGTVVDLLGLDLGTVVDLLGLVKSINLTIIGLLGFESGTVIFLHTKKVWMSDVVTSLTYRFCVVFVPWVLVDLNE